MLPENSASLLEHTLRTIAELIAEGPMEITSISGWHTELPDPGDDVEFHGHLLTTAFAAGVYPGAFYGEFTPWPVEMAEATATTLPDWLVLRWRGWPDEDVGGLFERIGVLYSPQPTRKKGKRRDPVVLDEAVWLAKSWISVVEEKELVAAAAALRLVVDVSVAAGPPVEDDNGWTFTGEVYDIRGEVCTWVTAILGESDPEAIDNANEAAVSAWLRVTGEEEEKVRGGRRKAKASLYDADLTRATPWVFLTMDVREEILQGERVTTADVLTRVKKLKPADVGHAAYTTLVSLLVAGMIPANASEDDVYGWPPHSGDDNYDRLLEVMAQPDPLEPVLDLGDPLDMLPQPWLLPEPQTIHARQADVWLNDAGGNFRKEEGQGGEELGVTLAHLVPATVAVVISRLLTGTWQERTSGRIDQLHEKLEAEYVQLDEPLNRAGDMITEFTPADNYAGLVTLAAPPQGNLRRTEAVQELVKRVLDRIEL